jgi:hypothetical protein
MRQSEGASFAEAAARCAYNRLAAFQSKIHMPILLKSMAPPAQIR